ncbi:glucose-1-phosphate adenylyltransferase [Fuerstiella marisgermanici]|uniref:Glucose-1-phosphate adenylyltransferase n=1 Tax=Fuerstiella marisgermanici TaxID=1891926 RepID=A0A1P8WKH6_9PLAN|nr:glucose-1-phosphate adenylyltransferase [Fuerstiella marisgermanici]APZ94556.1 Glucose-1-phosphate adenylyltransferase [Fuerstiella marisgermanici]
MDHCISLILGGGKGTRLLPLTQYRSKPAVPIGGKYRLIDVPISNCIHSDLNRIYVLTQFNSISLHRHIRQTYNFDLFSNGFVEILAAQQTPGETDWYQGTADAVRKQMRFLKQPGLKHVLILSGDQLYRMDYRQMLNTHLKSNADVTISTIPVNAQDARGFGIMQLDDGGKVVDFVEKPQDDDALNKVRTPADWIDAHGVRAKGREYLASMGIYLFDRDLLVDLLESSDHDDFGKHIFPMAIKHHHVQTHLFDDYWEDIGTIKAFFECNLAMASSDAPFRFGDHKHPIFTRPRFLPSTRFDNCEVKGSLIADGCTIGPGSKIENSVIGMRTTIGSNVTIRNSAIMGADYYVHDHSAPGECIGIGDNVVIDGALVDKNVYIGNGARIVSADAPPGDGDYDSIAVSDGIAVVRKRSAIPDNWSFPK